MDVVVERMNLKGRVQKLVGTSPGNQVTISCNNLTSYSRGK
jgi:hypothetical protein